MDYRDNVHVSASLRDSELLAGIHVLTGKHLAGNFPSNLKIDVTSTRQPTDFLKVGKLWIVSLRLKSILDAYRVDAEYFPVSLCRNKNTLCSGEWFCFNPTLTRNWFDRSKSQYSLEQDFAIDIISVAVDSDAIGDAPLAVSINTIPRLVCVTDDLARAILDGGCTGVLFVDPSEWQSPERPRI